MLVTTKELLRLAEAQNKAIGAFNITNLTMLEGILEAAEELKEPVIIEFAQLHEQEKVISLDVIGPIMVEMAKKANIPVAVHLDHGVELSFVKKALDIGFTSVMYDGSSLPYAENVANTIMAVQMAKMYGASVEAEIGKMAGVTLNDHKVTENRQLNKEQFTDPLEAKQFVAETGIDMLACAFGSVHGLHQSEPQLDFALVKTLHDTIGVPVVMHGGSGISEEDYDKLIEAGVRKVNHYAYMAKCGATSIRNLMQDDNILLIHEITPVVRTAIKEHVKKAMMVLRHDKA